MRMPTRAAPRPPNNPVAQRNAVWSKNSDPFGPTLFAQPVQKKKPPPRPPPPKFRSNRVQYRQEEKPGRPTRPTDLLTNLFGRSKPTKQQSIVAYSSNVCHPPGAVDASVSLIDLSPPGSPTFTTRSNSDGVSVDSFGSDGNSNPSNFTSSGNTSQNESAFEDDFDFFGELSKSKPFVNDPWKITANQDPFGPLESNNFHNDNVKRVGDTCFFSFNSESSTKTQVPFNQSTKTVVQSRPTIIRAKPPKPTAKPVLKTSSISSYGAINFSTENLTLTKNTVPLNKPVLVDVDKIWTNDSKDEPSPPMPSIPPPAPPSEYLTELDDGITMTYEKPYGIALYDFSAMQPGDLPLKEGDLVQLIKVVSDDWMEGCVGDNQGIFPINYVDIKVPLPGVSRNVVNALYTFNGETSTDLSFEEGAKITVLSRISSDWLYGQCEGREGQFPANYVDRVPSNLQNYS
ncbi:uncharacterized protein B0303.7 isoform X2 [Orussus abietinus]|nr:uncharacterized protein B0303.7 isoform X2 [Orussus abietinus]